MQSPAGNSCRVIPIHSFTNPKSVACSWSRELGPVLGEVDLSDLPGQVARVTCGVVVVSGSVRSGPFPAVEFRDELDLLAAVILGGVLSHCERLRHEVTNVEDLNGAATLEEHRLVHTTLEVIP